jgi:hypothetical protein
VGTFRKEKITLACGHVVELVQPMPVVGAYQFCYACDDYRVVALVPRPFTVRCYTRTGCYLGLSNDYEAAMSRLETHRKNKPDHEIRIIRGFQVVGLYTGRSNGYTLVHEELIEGD